MYELRQKQRKEMQEKKWFNIALLLTAIFLFSQGSALLKTNMEYALPIILLSFILHSSSIGKICIRILKIEASIIANIAMLVILSIITIACYFIVLKILFIVFLDLVAITIYVITAFICSKINIGEK